MSEVGFKINGRFHTSGPFFHVYWLVRGSVGLPSDLIVLLNILDRFFLLQIEDGK